MEATSVLNNSLPAQERGASERVRDAVKRVAVSVGFVFLMAAVLLVGGPVYALYQVIAVTAKNITGLLKSMKRRKVRRLFGEMERTLTKLGLLAVAIVVLVPADYAGITDPALKSILACAILYCIDGYGYKSVDTYKKLRESDYAHVGLLAIYGYIIGRCFGGI